MELPLHPSTPLHFAQGSGRAFRYIFFGEHFRLKRTGKRKKKDAAAIPKPKKYLEFPELF